MKNALYVQWAEVTSNSEKIMPVTCQSEGIRQLVSWSVSQSVEDLIK